MERGFSESSLSGVNWLALLVIVLTVFTSANALQTASRIEGTVTDQTGAPIAGAKVTLSSKDSSVKQTTNNIGRFVFDSHPAESGIIVVQAAGFNVFQRKWTAADNDLSTLEVVLTPSLSAQITVTAERTETRVSDTAASIAMLSSDDIASTAALTIDDALRQVPGFSLFRRSGSRTANPTSQGVSLRGVGASGASRAVVLADGVPINDPFGGWVFWGRTPREAINRIEVVQGGASSLYGTDALGGVINLITRDARQSALSLEASYGNEKTPDVSLFAGGSLLQWAGKISAEVFHTDGYVLVDESQRGRIDTRAGAEHSTLDVSLERLISNSGRIFARGSLFGETRENGTPLQINNTYIRQATIGTDLQSARAGSFSGM